MNIDTLRTKYSFSNIESQRISDTAIPRDSHGSISYKAEGEYIFINRNVAVRFSLRDADYTAAIEDLIKRQYINVARVTATNNDIFMLTILFFPSSKRFDQLQVIVGEHVRNALINKGIMENDSRDFSGLVDNFCFDNGLDECFVFSTGKVAVEITDKDKETVANNNNSGIEKIDNPDNEEPSVSASSDREENANDSVTMKDGLNSSFDEKESNDYDVKEDLEDGRKESVKIEGAFRIFGAKFDLLIRIESIGEQVRVVAYKAIFQKRSSEMLQQIGFGKLSFSDEKSYVAASVRRILKDPPNYLTSWDEYAKKEGEFLLAKAKSVGVITCSSSFNAENSNGNIIMTVTDLVEDDHRFDMLGVGDVLEMTDDLPIFLQDDITWEAYKGWLNEQQKELEEEKRTAKENNVKFEPKKKIYFKITSLPNNSKFLGLSPLVDNVTFPSGNIHFIYSVRGDEVQISRREEARNRISNGTAAMPNLGLILSADMDASAYGVSSNARGKKIEPLSPLVRKKCFDDPDNPDKRGNPPTAHQEKAISIALNTPDIAIIQGPPGTGKTTVITAILERLNEISDKNNTAPGNVLVTSLQHDAVNNVIERIRINSLPTIKFGRRGMETKETLDESVQKWCTEAAEKMEAKHDFLGETAETQECFRLFNLYNMAPNRKRAIDFLTKAKELAKTDIVKRIDDILSDLRIDADTTETDNLLRLIYRLRTTADGFADDGQECAMALYYELEELFGDCTKEWQQKTLDTLRQVTASSVSDDMLRDMKMLRRNLLDRYKPKPHYEPVEPREDIIAVYHELRESLRHPEDAKREIIYNLHAELREGTPEIKRALSAYTFAFAATAQQSDSRDIKFAKGVSDYKELTSHASYDTIIVDEAARVSPGDLMIPLSQGERRIIMVGDQKQLPHIYDEEIFEKLREEGKIASDDDIQISMFQHLWQTAKELEKRDGIQRTITLDKQYRTHPLLGDFVSKNFYERDGEGFSSPRKAEEFVQPITHHACVWVDLPNAKGAPKRLKNGSRQREAEAVYIVDKLIEYLSRSDCKSLSFGVITFYSAQRELIKSKFKEKFGEMDKDIINRVRIGTVDEFQGMEFDVIFLSVVRSGSYFKDVDLEKLESPSAEQDGILREMTSKYYGFLNDNRLCVALSRQKKLLIVVGDGAMFSGRNATPFAKRCVPAMYNLYVLCEGEGSVVDG